MTATAFYLEGRSWHPHEFDFLDVLPILHNVRVNLGLHIQVELIVLIKNLFCLSSKWYWLQNK